jgi:hypothetical protein
MRTEFSCMAEAVSHFYAIGYKTIQPTTNDDLRIMTKGNHKIRIRRMGFLNTHVF